MTGDTLSKILDTAVDAAIFAQRMLLKHDREGSLRALKQLRDLTAAALDGAANMGNVGLTDSLKQNDAVYAKAIEATKRGDFDAALAATGGRP
jgi:hypothetical protein